MTLTELIAALEAATEGSEAMDIAITELFHPVGERGSYTPYTRSLDAALTLVPEGAAWRITRRQQGDYYAIVQEKTADEPGFKTWVETGDLQTPALAMCMAALKARQS